MSDTHTATVLLVVTVREADTGPEGLKTVSSGDMVSASSLIFLVISVLDKLYI